MPQPLVFGNRIIGPGHPIYIVAELSCNHNGSLETAKELVRSAAASGADAIKVQHYTPDTMTINCDNEYFTIKGTIWDGRTLYDLYQQAYTPWEWTAELKKEANSLGLDFFSSPFDPSAVDFLEKVGVDLYKVASFEIVDHPLLTRIGQTGKPVIISTGMASLKDIDSAIRVLRQNGCGPIAVLKCTSSYPAKPEDANLLNIPNIRDTFDVVSGLSDHTIDLVVPVTSVALGACIIEKHFTLDNQSGSPDDLFSLTPTEFKEMVEAVRKAEKVLGKVTYGGVSSEDTSRQLRRSLFVVKDIKAGEAFTAENVRSIRPGHGLHPENYWHIINYGIARVDIKRGTPLQWNLIN